MMTNQELMDLPGAGAAERQLRKDGRWVLTPYEKMEGYVYDLEIAIDMAQDAHYKIEHLCKELTQ
jgi:hypothetical protein